MIYKQLPRMQVHPTAQAIIKRFAAQQEPPLTIPDAITEILKRAGIIKKKGKNNGN